MTFVNFYGTDIFYFLKMDVRSLNSPHIWQVIATFQLSGHHVNINVIWNTRILLVIQEHLITNAMEHIKMPSWYAYYFQLYNLFSCCICERLIPFSAKHTLLCESLTSLSKINVKCHGETQSSRCHSGPWLSQWKEALLYNAFSHWPSPHSKYLGPLLLTWINFNPNVDKKSRTLKGMGGKYLSIPKHRWSLRKVQSNSISHLTWHVTGIEVKPC